jgi:addiction module RelE/StbE family toxin
MEFQARLKLKAQRELNNLSPKDYCRAMEAISLIAINPFANKKLRGEYRSCYSYRFWPYRIIYKIYKKELIVIIDIGHRQDIY